MRPNEDFRPEHVAGWLIHDEPALCVVNKPAGVLSQPGPKGEPDLVTLARAHFGQSTLAVLHRLDRNVSGLVLLAKSAEAARWLSPQFAAGTVERAYVAVCRGRITEERLTIEAPLRKDERTNTVTVAPMGEPGAQATRTEVEILERAQGLVGRLSLVKARPISGRSHQLRVHLAHVGLPIVGDSKYGIPAKGLHRVLLHAAEVAFTRPDGSPSRYQATAPFTLGDATMLRPLR